MKHVRLSTISAMWSMILKKKFIDCANILEMNENDPVDCSSFISEGVTVTNIDDNTWHIHLPKGSSIYAAMCPVDIELQVLSGDVIEITLDDNLENVKFMQRNVPFAIHANKESVVLIKSLD